MFLQGKEHYQFSVADDAAGIAAEHQEIFAIFQTLVARDSKENTGVGSSIVKKISNLRSKQSCKTISQIIIKVPSSKEAIESFKHFVLITKN